MALPLSSLRPDPSEQQRTASDPATSVWVSASAGSGKTTVLTKRVLRLLLDGVRPEKILCLTYTRAAAAEMSIRIMEKLSAWATCDDDTLRGYLDELQGKAPIPRQLMQARRLFAQTLACPGGMRIRTIHAFCQEILGRFPLEAGVPPHFSVIEEADSHVLQNEALNDVLRASFDTEPELAAALATLVDSLGAHQLMNALQNLMKESVGLAAFLERRGLDGLMADLRAFLEVGPDETVETLRREAVDFAFVPQADLKEAAQKLLTGGVSFQKRGEAILAWLRQKPEERAAQFESYALLFLTQEGNIRSQLAPKALVTRDPECDALLKREAARLLSIAERLDTLALMETNAALFTLGAALIRRVSVRKAARAALDFGDLIARTRDVLKRPGLAPWVLYKLDGGIDHILVDEAQDTSLAQWDIVTALTEEFFAGTCARDVTRTLFVVGDEKQSIFSFQNADPEAFAAMKKHFAERIAKTAAFADVPLRLSFRSAPLILRAVDAVFSTEQARAGVSVEPVRHFAFKHEKKGRVEIWPTVVSPDVPEDESSWVLPGDYETESDPEVVLADHIAATIKGWLTDGAMLEDEARPIAAGDIMILLRRRGRFANLMVRALKKKDVPVTGVDRMVLTEQLAVMDLLALMQFVLLPEDDLNLATVLRGPFVGYSEEQLMPLAIGRKGTLWQELEAQKDAAHAYLGTWLQQADYVTPFAFLSRVLTEPCPASAVSGKQALWGRLGADALDPVEELLTAAQDFSRRHPPSLQQFLQQIMTSATTIKREMDQGAGQVRIMTVHGSKGLEAPIVFLPDTRGVPKTQDVPKFHWTETGLPLYVPTQPDSGAARRVWERARRRQLEEYRRLLYVALTRAVSRLYIGGVEPAKKESAVESWHHLIVEGMKAADLVVEEGAVFPAPLLVLDDRVPLETCGLLNDKADVRVTLPDWVRTRPGSEPAALPVVTPSYGVEAAATPDSAFARGKLIHRLLQSLPDLDDSQREAAARRFLANPQHRLTLPQQEEIGGEVVTLLRNPAYAPLFGQGSRAEVPLVGLCAGRTIVGQVDRLWVSEKEVWIVDYKTNRPPPARAEDIPDVYRVQLAGYRDVLRLVYPDKALRCFLLWTYAPRLMEVVV